MRRAGSRSSIQHSQKTKGEMIVDDFVISRDKLNCPVRYGVGLQSDLAQSVSDLGLAKCPGFVETRGDFLDGHRVGDADSCVVDEIDGFGLEVPERLVELDIVRQEFGQRLRCCGIQGLDQRCVAAVRPEGAFERVADTALAEDRGSSRFRPRGRIPCQVA